MPEPTPDLIHACPTCGPTATEPHPRLPIDRCSNCKEHITPGAARTTTSDGAGCDLVEPDNPTAWALARHIADYPVPTLQAAFRYLNSRLTIELHEDPDFPAPEPGLRETYRATVLAVDLDDVDAITDAVLAVRDAELQQLREELARCRDRFATQAENGAALALDLGATEAANARVAALAERWRYTGDRKDGPLRELLAALDQPRGECRRCHCPASAPQCGHCNCCDVPDQPQEEPAVNPPGSTREQLPADLLALLDMPPYLSTACATAVACERVAEVHRDERPWLLAHAEDLHNRCRQNHKFTGQACACDHHQDPS